MNHPTRQTCIGIIVFGSLGILASCTTPGPANRYPATRYLASVVPAPAAAPNAPVMRPPAVTSSRPAPRLAATPKPTPPSKPQPSAESLAKAQAKAQAKEQAKATAKAQAQAQAQAKADAKAQAKAQAHVQAQAQAQAPQKPQTKPKSAAATGTASAKKPAQTAQPPAESKAQAKTQTQTLTKTQPKSGNTPPATQLQPVAAGERPAFPFLHSVASAFKPKGKASATKSTKSGATESFDPELPVTLKAKPQQQ